LLQKFKRVPKEKPADASADPTKLAIGVEGGFLDEKWDTVKEYSLLVVDAAGARTMVAYPCDDLPMIISSTCQAIMEHQGANSMDAVNRWDADEELKDSKYYKDLVQLPPTRKISPHPKDWKCEVSGDTQNLWLNLSDGHIGGGRKFFDGSGGSNGALDHFNEEKAKGNFYPLVVKLGTITPQGADVFSYAPDEDNMVKNPSLAQHLQHWGIDVMRMDKTEKTMAELEVEKNLNYDWSRICESGEKLERLRGPGLVGLKNLGNSCYMNSSVQMLLGLPEFKNRYLDADLQIRRSAPQDSPASDLVSQVSKLVSALNTDRYAPALKEGEDEDDPKLLVAPGAFRSLIGKGHPEFSSGGQQDAAEFIQYFLEQLARAERTALGSRVQGESASPSFFEYSLEERLQEEQGQGRVMYKKKHENILGLPVFQEDADNLEEILAFKAAHPESGEKDAKKPKTEGEPEEPKPVIQLKSCLARWAKPEGDLHFRGGTVARMSRFATMPRYLMVQVQRYYLDEKWCPNKLDCRVPMPEEFNMEHLRAQGLQPGEQEMPPDEGSASAPAAAASGPKYDEMVVAQLTSMGVTENGAKRASIAVGSAGADTAAAWYFEHMEDADINDPIPEEGAAPMGGGGGGERDEEAISMLTCMGFSDAHAAAALKHSGNSAERAADWLFSHSDDLDGAVAALSGGSSGGGSAPAAGSSTYDDGVGDYCLVGFISHIGKHVGSGHYVCHMKHGDAGWVIFDDEKVAKSESPPLELGYLYLYRRKDVSSS
jgi:ubiquitin carboxyl-terminal hydrolase 5/13